MDFYDENIAMPGYVGPLERANKVTGTCGAICSQAIELLKQGRKDEAIELLEKSTVEHPRWTPLRQLLARFYLEAKRVPEARREIERLEDLAHKDPSLLVALAVALGNKREFADAILYLREAQALGLEAGEWQLLTAEALLRTGRLQEAEAVYEKLMPIIGTDIQRSRLFVGLSAVRLQQKRFTEAATFAQDALKTGKVKYRAFYFLGLALMRMGEHEDAVTSFERFAKYQPHRVAPYRWLERYAREAGDDDQADAYNLKARELLESRRLLQLERKRRASGK